MSEVLLIAVDQPGTMRWKKGDIVAVFPDGHQWGSREGLPIFWQLTITSLIDTDRPTLLESVPDPILLNRILRRRKRFIDVTQLSQFAQNNLTNTGHATVLRLAFLAALTLRP